MDKYELEREAEAARKRARNAQADLESAELERERSERTANEAKTREAAARRQMQAERDEHSEMVEGLQNHVSELQERANRQRHELDALTTALRALVDALPHNQAASLIYFAGTPLAKACAEALELLRIIDALKKS